jgi:hypothetical protein
MLNKFLVTTKVLQAASLSIIALLSSDAKAVIPETAFKNVTKHFATDKKYLSPTLGQAARRHLIHNLRFDGNFTPEYREDGVREYSKDHSLDPTWHLVKLLFPSPGGHINIETGAESNFAKNVTTPETIAILLNYANKVREEGKVDAILQKEAIRNVAYTLSQGNEIIKIEFKKISSRIVDPTKKIIQAIGKSILQEKNGFYPLYTTEQIINAFFCERFNSQKDIWTLLNSLDESIIPNKKDIPTDEDLLTKNYIEVLKNKSYDDIDLDDIFYLNIKDNFNSNLPNNGCINTSTHSSYFYDRKNNAQRSVRTL